MVPLTGWVGPQERSIILLHGHRRAIKQHVHIRPSDDSRASHAAFLALELDEIRDSALCIVVAPVKFRIPILVL